MHFDPSRSIFDLPVPPTIEERARAFPVPLMTLVPQDSVQESSAGATSETADGRLIAETVSLSYTFWRHPADHADPRNLAALDDELLAALDTPVAGPDWFLEARERMRYPILWEAVRTGYRSEDPREQSLEQELVDHLNHVVTNVFREERVTGGFPGTLGGAASLAHVQRAVPVQVDGAELPGAQIDSDPHMFGVGVDLGNRLLTAVIPREYLPHLIVAFRTHPAALAASS